MCVCIFFVIYGVRCCVVRVYLCVDVCVCECFCCLIRLCVLFVMDCGVVWFVFVWFVFVCVVFVCVCSLFKHVLRL